MSTTTLRGVLFATTGIACMATMPVAAQANTELRQFAIPAQSAETAIGILGHQANVQIIASRKVTRAVRTNEVRGRLTVSDALERMFAGTGLAARQTGPATFAVIARPLSTRAPLATQTVALASQANWAGLSTLFWYLPRLGPAFTSFTTED